MPGRYLLENSDVLLEHTWASCLSNDSYPKWSEAIV
jgi:hypothetical protein